MIRSASLSRLFIPLAGVAVAIALASAAQSAASYGTPLDDRQAMASEAAQLFADAPDGVDPVVTGPVSAAFRQKQAAAGCADAVWPDIPAACYPD